MLKLAQTDRQTNRQGKNNMTPTTINLSHTKGLGANRQTDRPTDQQTKRQTGQKQYVPHYYSGNGVVNGTLKYDLGNTRSNVIHARVGSIERAKQDASSPCSKKEQTHRSEADIDVDDFAANWEMGFDISDIGDNVIDKDLDGTRAEGNVLIERNGTDKMNDTTENVNDDGDFNGDHITGNGTDEMDNTMGNVDDDGDVDGDHIGDQIIGN
ncbi:hypothetical protein DPMN_168486 [Dreissena polymorpha]|uniref:Uncharacterized protein n=1 Tax=Dreissena polymorpha TaxID=45954 RepID=A0A9D4F2U3_DREPO|nr:hypothetical protein DPMN_168486 [Dreissena polymorpha]